MKWIEIKITTVTEAVEAITNMLMDLGIAGVRIDDPKDILMQDKSETQWDYIDEELIGNQNIDTVYVICYVSETVDYIKIIEEIKSKLLDIKQFLPVGKGTVQIGNVDEEEWANAWKKYYKPTKIGNHIIIKPSWEEFYTNDSRDIIIEMDPGMAFGTGTHETTSMCIEFLEKYLQPQDQVLDIGCGSGILGIVASKLGASNVIGVDLDSNAVKVSKENVDRNAAGDKVDIRHGNLLDVVSEKGNLVVANIIADIIIQLTEVAADFLQPKGYFISSGIILERLNDVQQAMDSSPFEIIEIQQKGEWAAIVARLKE